jgi:hypothetical protein
MKIMLSQRDRALAKISLDSVPWQGGEDGVTALYELLGVIGAKDFDNLPADTAIKSLDSRPVAVTMSRPQVELLIAVLCGGGRALTPDVGKTAAELVVRLRKQCPRSSGGAGAGATPVT